MVGQTNAATTSMNGEPLGINAVDIVKILGEEGYANYVEGMKNNQNYIKKGVWYDRKERNKIRLESWREKQLESTKKIESKEEEMTPAKQKSLDKKMEDVRKSLTNKNILK